MVQNVEVYLDKSSRWTDAHTRLRQLYEERVPKGMTQAEFGKTYGIGTQGMVWQYLAGHRPLNIEAAAKFARGLRCNIRDISPEMADALESEIVPMLGAKALKRAVAKIALLFMAALFYAPPAPADAAVKITAPVYYVKLRRWLQRLFARNATS